MTNDNILADIQNKLPTPSHFHSFYKEQTKQIKSLKPNQIFIYT